MCTNLREFTYFSKNDGRRKRCLIKCGFCLECQMSKSREWAERLMKEGEKHKDMCFVTLTYNDDNCPEELNIRDFQLFMKRLRKAISPTKVLYFMSGEYGEKGGRPHYHVILFGWKPKDLIYFSKTSRGEDIYLSSFLEEKWGKGYISVGDVTYNSCLYLGKYIQKYTVVEGKRKPFITMSTSVTLGFERDSMKNVEKPTYFVNGCERPIPNSLLRRAEKDGFDVSSIKYQREIFVDSNFDNFRQNNLLSGKLGVFENNKEKKIAKDFKNYEKFFKKGIDKIKKICLKYELS